jgi:hypothetical protein
MLPNQFVSEGVTAAEEETTLAYLAKMETEEVTLMELAQLKMKRRLQVQTEGSKPKSKRALRLE